jgi:hypothetical protein
VFVGLVTQSGGSETHQVVYVFEWVLEVVVQSMELA